MEVSMSITRRGKYTDSNICMNVQVCDVACLFFLLYANLLVLVTLCEGNHFRFIEERYVYFLKLQNFLRINFCKVPCFERRLHIVSEKFGLFCCYSDCFAAKILFYLKNQLINSLFSFILRTFAEHSQ